MTIMTLSSLLSGLDVRFLTQNNPEIADIVYDSRKAKPGCLFAALTGSASDGHDYIAAAYENGCRAFLVEKDDFSFFCKKEREAERKDFSGIPSDTAVALCKDTRLALALASAALFRHPARDLRLVGLTGTKGKTSVSYMLRDILESCGRKTGIIGTTGAFAAGHEWPLANTTPESYELHKLLFEMKNTGVTDVVIEASSWGLFMRRLAGVTFDIGVFLNLSPDHIGGVEHPDEEHYIQSKRLLFDQCRTALINRDDPISSRMCGTVKNILTFGTSPQCDYTASALEPVRSDGTPGIRFRAKTPHREMTVTLPMPGRHNAMNALAALACADLLGADCEPSSLASARVRGRVESLPVPAPFTVMIDYAHNALSVQNLMDTVKAYQPSKIITVFGCGGNRAAARRYDMGRIAAAHSDFCVLTSDNPRSEQVGNIISDILVGVNESGGAYEIVPDRREAIHRALSLAPADSMVLIIGKGHQCYEEINGVRYPFDEREVVAEFFA